MKTKVTGVTLNLPCMPGDTVYFPEVSRFSYGIIDVIHIENRDNKTHIVFEWYVNDNSSYDEGPELWDDGEFELEDIGETVFLTKEDRDAYMLSHGFTEEQLYGGPFDGAE